MKNNLCSIGLLLTFLLAIVYSPGSPWVVLSQDNPQQDDSITLVGQETLSPYFSVETFTLSDGTLLNKDIINGPPQPPAAFDAEREASLMTDASRSTLANFPSYNWVFGCSAVSAGMIAGYYDRTGYPNIYTGPTNSGDMPLSDTTWPIWTDTAGVSYVNNPLISSKQGVDGRSIRGSIENYWLRYNTTDPDPYLTSGWPEHTWGTAIGDYMKTSQSAWPYQSRDGSTWFWNYSDKTKLTCDAMPSIGVSGGAYTVADVDGTYGRKQFYEARGYTVTDCFNQLTDNQTTGSFSLADFKAQIDAGHPVFLNLQGHSIVGFGYSGSTIYIRDTWDSNPQKIYSMPWGGSYAGMVLRSVSIVRLAPPCSTSPSALKEVTASDGAYFDKVRISWAPVADAAHYRVFRNTENKFTEAIELTTCPAWSPFDDCHVPPGEVNYYWVMACNAVGCSAPSNPVTGWRFPGRMNYLPMIIK